jgi:phosphatidylinositol dimannoside acyltransferase
MFGRRRVPKGRPGDEGRLIQLVYYGYVALSRVARALPEPVAYGVAWVCGGVAARLSRKRGAVAGNLARITDAPAGSRRVQKLVVETYRCYARYWLETFMLVREGKEFFLDRFRVVAGEDHLDAVLSAGKGAVVIVGHLGNWDAAGAWVGARGNRLVTVAEVLRPRRMFDFFAAHRARLGMTIYPAERGAVRRLVEAIDDGAVVAVVGDRDLRGRGPRVRFFGEDVHMPGGPASIAIRTGVTPLVAGVYGVTHERGKRGWIADISEPIELPDATGPEAVRLLTQRIATLLEAYIARRPEEWHVLQPFWLPDRARS